MLNIELTTYSSVRELQLIVDKYVGPWQKLDVDGITRYFRLDSKGATFYTAFSEREQNQLDALFKGQGYILLDK